LEDFLRTASSFLHPDEVGRVQKVFVEGWQIIAGFGLMGLDTSQLTPGF